MDFTAHLGFRCKISKKSLFNENGDIEVSKKRIINGNTTNLNDFNNMKYRWAADWYRQAMNNFWIPEEINLAQDLKDYGKLTEEEKKAYDKIMASTGTSADSSTNLEGQ